MAKIVAAVVTVAKVAAVITAAVVIVGVTYHLASLTKEKIDARAREAEKEEARKKDNPKYYYIAQIIKGSLLIAANPHTLRQAVANVKKGASYWTIAGYMAKKLAIESSGGYKGPEIDKSNGSPKKGYYYHYHLPGKQKGVHCCY